MKLSIQGALVGAVVGACARSGVVLLNLGEAVPLIFVLPSASIGVLVGLIAGSTAKPLTGAVVGALLSAVIFELFMLPCASLIGTFGSVTGDEHASARFLQKTLLYALEMGVAGALAGGIGGWMGSREFRDQSAIPESVSEEAAE